MRKARNVTFHGREAVRPFEQGVGATLKLGVQGAWTQRAAIRTPAFSPRADDGFTLVELVISLAVVAVGLMLLTAGLANSLRPLALSKQRSAAVAAGQEVLEQARSLHWADLGLVATDATLPQNGGADPAIVQVGGVWKFGAGCPSGTPCEPIQYATNTGSHPFALHMATLTRDTTTLTRYVYVTGLDTNNDGVIDLRRVTVRTTWANSVMASVSTTVRLSTMISSAGNGSGSGGGAPLVGSVNVNGGHATLSAGIGAGNLVSPLIAQLTNPFATLEDGATNPRNYVNCTAKSTTITIPGGSTFGPAALSNAADDDPQSADPYNAGPTTVNAPGTGEPGDVENWISQNAVPGNMTCLSTVYGTDHIAGGAADLPYGSVSTAGPAALTFQQSVTAAVPLLGTIKLLDLQDSGSGANASGTETTNPVGTVVSSATLRQVDQRIMVVNAPLLPLPILAPNGLVRVEAFTATATATGQSSGTPPAPTVTPPVQLKIWIYDPLLQLPTPSVCDLRSLLPDPLGYCVILLNPLSPKTITNLSEGLTQGLLIPAIRYTVSITPGTVSTGSPPNATGTTWTARYTPMSLNVHLCATTGTDCDAAGKVLDLEADLDLGSLQAQAIKGF